MKNQPSVSSLSRLTDFTALMLGSCFFSSYLPSKISLSLKVTSAGRYLSAQRWTGAGFVGSLWGAVTYLLLPIEISQSLWAPLIGLLMAVPVAGRAEKIFNNHDDSRIVVDEWLGAWIALWGLDPQLNPPFILAFLAFRGLDVLKGPWGKFWQKLPGGWGVVMDDVFAGFLANLLIRFFLYFSNTGLT
ncbi:MAG: phosphatidylglycerophosphatase A [Elusimicrobia bacterium]|nr:phosphatidylglycerophosphatase A [Candidatus Obscuribacterium magneticum]